MSPEVIRERIQAQLPGAQVVTSGEDCNFAVEVTSEHFEGKKPIERHRLVNELFKDELADGRLHALSIKTATPE